MNTIIFFSWPPGQIILVSTSKIKGVKKYQYWSINNDWRKEDSEETNEANMSEPTLGIVSATSKI